MRHLEDKGLKIEGVFSSKMLSDYPICIDTYGYLAVKHMSFMDENVKLLLKKMPDFETVFDTFVNKTIAGFIFNNILDVCLSLFYKPYFDEFYDKIKQCFNQISILKKKYLKKHMLEYLADDTQYEIIVKRKMIDKSVRDYYVEKGIYAKSKELLEVI